MYLYLKCNVKGGIQNTNFKVKNQQKNNTCHVQYLKKKTFTLAPLTLLTLFSSKKILILKIICNL
jgi:hypothetical protein